LSEQGSLLDWFGKRRESVVMKGVREHTQKVVDTVSELNRAEVAVCKGEKERALDAIKRVSLSEKEADHMEEVITEELSKGDLDSKEREDLMHLIRRLDTCADWAKEAALNLQMILEANVPVPVTLWKMYCAMSGELEKATKSLKSAVDSLGVDEEAVNQGVRGVEVQEHILDEMYFTTKKEILFADTDPKAIFLLRDILHAVENSADSCKDASDMIKIVMVAQKHKAR
jgi:predicted phosphate transport protein (TIGR00153 family)